jgi:hypothetical protein
LRGQRKRLQGPGQAAALPGGPQHGKGRAFFVDNGLYHLAIAQAEQAGLLGIDQRAAPFKKDGL